jgi:hypothetical protein
MFLRFVSAQIDEDAQVRTGIFQAAYDLQEFGHLRDYDQQVLSDLMNWFEEYLARPTRFCRSRRPGRLPKGVCWFRPSAWEHLKRIWEMVRILEDNGV